MIQEREVTSCAGACRVYVDVGNDPLRVSQRGRDGQLLPPNEVLPESLVIQAFGISLSTCESR